MPTEDVSDDAEAKRKTDGHVATQFWIGRLRTGTGYFFSENENPQISEDSKSEVPVFSILTNWTHESAGYSYFLAKFLSASRHFGCLLDHVS
jgi:hypothetical protein